MLTYPKYFKLNVSRGEVDEALTKFNRAGNSFTIPKYLKLNESPVESRYLAVAEAADLILVFIDPKQVLHDEDSTIIT